ncbi:MAG: AAA family ATPase, partial [Gammaproteobacteria bacterium]|nr:AAA family ATPase [Gammaproteobacteria bacterium]
GITDYIAIRKRNMAYVDKTRFIADLEQTGDFLFFLRPRRFGKSLLVNQLWCYYDILFEERFESLFSGTYIGDHPTPEKNNYLVLYFNFAGVDPDPERVLASFSASTSEMFRHFLSRYHTYMDETVIRQVKNAEMPALKLRILFNHAAQKDLKLYVLIDEYDNFTNTILSMEKEGKSAYHQLTHGTGFFRHFFNVLKEGTSSPDSGLARLFVTGVSPVTMDDVTSGYNIGLQVSMEPPLAEACGFTRE